MHVAIVVRGLRLREGACKSTLMRQQHAGEASRPLPASVGRPAKLAAVCRQLSASASSMSLAISCHSSQHVAPAQDARGRGLWAGHSLCAYKLPCGVKTRDQTWLFICWALSMAQPRRPTTGRRGDRRQRRRHSRHCQQRRRVHAAMQLRVPRQRVRGTRLTLLSAAPHECSLLVDEQVARKRALAAGPGPLSSRVFLPGE